MAESFCGKTCQICTLRSGGNCPGCRVGPGQAFSGDCEIARCCREKGHAECESCTLRGNCGKLRVREGMAAFRQRRLDEQNERNARLAREVPVLAKWLWALFIVVICGIVASIFSTDELVVAIPGLLWPGLVLDLLISIASGVILLQLGGISGRYRIAGWCGIVVTVVDFIPNLLPAAKWMGYLAFITMIPALIGEFQEMQAHADQLEGIDDELAEKWRKLWYWYLISMIVTLFSGLLTALASILGALIMLAAMGSLIVVSVLRIVYLYRTAQRFRNFPLDKLKIQEKFEISS